MEAQSYTAEERRAANQVWPGCISIWTACWRPS